jgi:hypothetical protein
MTRWMLGVVLAVSLCGPAAAQAPIQTYDSGPVPVEVTLAAGTLSTGNALGLFTIPFLRVPGGSGIVTTILWKSVNGDATAKLGRLWSAKPVNTTCNNGAAFVGSDVDDAALVGPGPFSFNSEAIRRRNSASRL